jgi:Pyridoxamine 5'-phosphate oxidase
MTASLPPPVQDVFAKFITTEYTTVDSAGRPIAWPVTPYYEAGGACIDVTTGLGYPKKANDARANPKVALLFSDPTGSGLERPPTVLVQGTAAVDDSDLAANRARYARESLAKLPATKKMNPPEFLRRFLGWYYNRIYVHVRPERVYVWAAGDPACEPAVYGSHLEETRSGHNEEPEVGHADPAGGMIDWDARVNELATRYRTAVLSCVCPDGFPFAARVAIAPEPAARRIEISTVPLGVPVEPGPACLTAHDHAPDFTWQRNFQLRGDLVKSGDGWALIPHRLVGGFELPPGSMLSRYRLNAKKMMRFRRIAKRELAKRAARSHE